MEMYYGSKGIDNYLEVKLGYIREISKSGRSYQIMMLCENNINGFLTPMIREIDGMVWLRYCSNTLYVLDRLFRKHKPDWNMTKQLVGQIEEDIEVLKKYLLNPDDIVLNPEYMFYSEETKGLVLVCVPGYGVRIRVQLRAFLEYIMSRFDSRDRDGIACLYELHDNLNDENGNIKLFSDLYEESINSSKKIFDNENENNNELQHLTDEKDVYSDVSNAYYHRQGISKLFAGIVVLITILLLIVFDAPVYFWLFPALEVLFTVSEINKDDMSGRQKISEGIKTNATTGINRKETAMYEMGDCNTLEYASKLIPLTNGALPELDIMQLSTKLTIGRDSSCSDYSLNTTQISRIHAYIYKDNKNLYLEDCNSTNGTFINYSRIPAMKPMMVKPGDIVGFADEEFYVS